MDNYDIFENDFKSALKIALENESAKMRKINEEKVEVMAGLFKKLSCLISDEENTSVKFLPVLKSGMISIEVSEIDFDSLDIDIFTQCIGESTDISITPLLDGNIRISMSVNNVLE